MRGKGAGERKQAGKQGRGAKGHSGREMVEGVSEKEEGSSKSQGGGRDLLTCFGLYVYVRVLVYTHVCTCVLRPEMHSFLNNLKSLSCRSLKV